MKLTGDDRLGNGGKKLQILLAARSPGWRLLRERGAQGAQQPLSPLAALKIDEWNGMIDVNIRGVL